MSFQSFPSPNARPHSFGFTDQDVTTTNAFADAAIMAVEGMKDISIGVQNTGGANGASYQVLASRDGGNTYPYTAAASANVAFGAVGEVFLVDKLYTHIKVQVKDQVAASHTTVAVQICAA